MSARAVTLWFIEGDDPAGALRDGITDDPDAAVSFAQRLVGGDLVIPTGTVPLSEAAADPDPHRIYVGHFGALTVLCWAQLGQTPTAAIPELVPAVTEASAAVLLLAEPELSLGGFARWEHGQSRREFVATPVEIMADEGLPFIFEGKFWAGEHPLHYAPGVPVDPLALPFHPQQLAEEANRSWLGFRFTHPLADSDLDPATITVSSFSIRPAGYSPEEFRREFDESAAGRGSASAHDDAQTNDTPTNGAPNTELQSAERQPGPLSRFFGFRGRL